jgi:hypothetical protein
MCDKKIDNDSRVVGCYANQTRSWWWEIDVVNCCKPFFEDMFPIKEQNDRNKGKEELDLRELQTPGGTLLHEMLHCNAITSPLKHNKHSPSIWYPSIVLSSVM